MTTALLSNDTELLQRAREVLVEKGFIRAYTTRCPVAAIVIYTESGRFGEHGNNQLSSDIIIHLTPDNFDSVLSEINTVI